MRGMQGRRHVGIGRIVAAALIAVAMVVPMCSASADEPGAHNESAARTESVKSSGVDKTVPSANTVKTRSGSRAQDSEPSLWGTAGSPDRQVYEKSNVSISVADAPGTNAAGNHICYTDASSNYQPPTVPSVVMNSDPGYMWKIQQEGNQCVLNIYPAPTWPTVSWLEEPAVNSSTYMYVKPKVPDPQGTPVFTDAVLPDPGTQVKYAHKDYVAVGVSVTKAVIHKVTQQTCGLGVNGCFQTNPNKNWPTVSRTVAEDDWGQVQPDNTDRFRAGMFSYLPSLMSVSGFENTDGGPVDGKADPNDEFYFWRGAFSFDASIGCTDSASEPGCKLKTPVGTGQNGERQDVEEMNLDFLKGVKFYPNAAGQNQKTDLMGLFENSGLTNINLNNTNDQNHADVSNVANLTGVFMECNNLSSPSLVPSVLSLPSVDLTDLDINSAQDVTELLANCSNLGQDTNADNYKTKPPVILAGLKANSLIIADQMFAGCSKMYSFTGGVDGGSTPGILGGLKLQYAIGMFQNCFNLHVFNPDEVVFSAAKSLDSMFLDCYELKDIDMDNFILPIHRPGEPSTQFRDPMAPAGADGLTHGVITSSMFIASGVENVTFKNLDMSGITDASLMFSQCPNIVVFNAVDLNLTSATTLQGMFEGCPSLKYIRLSCYAQGLPDWTSSDFTAEQNSALECSPDEIAQQKHVGIDSATNIVKMFADCPKLVMFDASYLNGSSLKNISDLLKSDRALVEVKLDHIAVPKLTDMSDLCQECSSLQKFSSKDVNLASVTNMEGLFLSCSALASADFTGTTTSNNLHNVALMFYATLQLPGFVYGSGLDGLDFSGVTNASQMFDGSGIKAFSFPKKYSSKGFNALTDAHGMFSDCTNLAITDFSGFSTGAALQDVRHMFANCANVKTLDLGGLGTPSVTRFDGMFAKCEHLTDLDISQLSSGALYNTDATKGAVGDVSQESHFTDMFADLPFLAEITIGSGFKSEFLTPAGAGDPNRNLTITDVYGDGYEVADYEDTVLGAVDQDYGQRQWSPREREDAMADGHSFTWGDMLHRATQDPTGVLSVTHYELGPSVTIQLYRNKSDAAAGRNPSSVDAIAGGSCGSTNASNQCTSKVFYRRGTENDATSNMRSATLPDVPEGALGWSSDGKTVLSSNTVSLDNADRPLGYTTSTIPGSTATESYSKPQIDEAAGTLTLTAKAHSSAEADVTTAKGQYHKRVNNFVSPYVYTYPMGAGESVDEATEFAETIASSNAEPQAELNAKMAAVIQAPPDWQAQTLKLYPVYESSLPFTGGPLVWLLRLLAVALLVVVAVWLRRRLISLKVSSRR